MTQADATSLPYATMPPGVNRKLYDSASVGWATFLGTPIAGSVVMAMNYRRLGKPSAATIAVVVGVLATIVLMAIGFFIPLGSGSTAMGIGALAATVGAANALQGPAIKEHKNAGGVMGSRWVGAGIGAIGLLIFGGIILAIVFSTGLSGTRLVVGTKDEIYYSGTATQADAQALGTALKTAGFLTDRGVSVQLKKGTAGTVIGFVVQDGIWDDAGKVDLLKSMVSSVAPSVGGLPVKLQLLNTSGRVKKEVTVQ